MMVMMMMRKMRMMMVIEMGMMMRMMMMVMMMMMRIMMMMMVMILQFCFFCLLDQQGPSFVCCGWSPALLSCPPHCASSFRFRRFRYPERS
jgi:hypothetical protein